MNINSMHDPNSPFPTAIKDILAAMYAQLFKGDMGVSTKYFRIWNVITCIDIFCTIFILLYYVHSPKQLNPFKREFYKRSRKAVKFLREVGGNLIESRREALMAGDPVPEDILTHAIRVAGTSYNLKPMGHSLLLSPGTTAGNIIYSKH